MSIESKVDRMAGTIREQTGEALNDQALANDGRSQRNVGRANDGLAPLKSQPDIHQAD